MSQGFDFPYGFEALASKREDELILILCFWEEDKDKNSLFRRQTFFTTVPLNESESQPKSTSNISAMRSNQQL